METVGGIDYILDFNGTDMTQEPHPCRRSQLIHDKGGCYSGIKDTAAAAGQ